MEGEPKLTNIRAATVIQQMLMAKTLKLYDDEREALHLAVTALQHQPEPQPISQQCVNCGYTDVGAYHATCDSCGSSDLRPIYTTSEVKP